MGRPPTVRCRRRRTAGLRGRVCGTRAARRRATSRTRLRLQGMASARRPAWAPPRCRCRRRSSRLVANPKRDERSVGREPQGSDRWIHELRNTSVGQVVELARTDLCDPDVHLSVPVRQKRHKVAVAGDRSGLLQAIEVGDRLKLCVSYGVSPEVFCPLKPEACANRQRDSPPAASAKTNLHLLERSGTPAAAICAGSADTALFPFSCPAEDSGRASTRPIPPWTHRPSPSCHAGADGRASPPASPSAGPSSHHV